MRDEPVYNFRINILSLKYTVILCMYWDGLIVRSFGTVWERLGSKHTSGGGSIHKYWWGLSPLKTVFCLVQFILVRHWDPVLSEICPEKNQIILYSRFNNKGRSASIYYTLVFVKISRISASQLHRNYIPKFVYWSYDANFWLHL